MTNYRIFRTNLDDDIYEDCTDSLISYVQKEFNIKVRTLKEAEEFLKDGMILVIQE